MPRQRRATRPYFAANPITLAQRLIGATLLRTLPTGERLAGRIVETEAYCGPDDKAAHSVNWRRTPRTEPMFGPPGTTYVFLTYGMHHCFNIACGEEGEPVAVLIRALEPTEGLAAMHRHAERTATGKPRLRKLTDIDICKGPARLCHAMAIDRTLSALDITRSPEISVEPAPPAAPKPRLVNTARIGVDYAGDWADRKLRWFDAASRCVSGPRGPRSTA